MGDTIQFDRNKQQAKPECMACEEMLADAVDQVLSDADQAWFDQHAAGCAECSVMVADATRGAAWLEMLKRPRPEPPAYLLERILAQTSGQAAGYETDQAGDVAGPMLPQRELLPVGAGFVAAQPANLLPFRSPATRRTGLPRFMFEPRLAMTAAMAFFSIALTLNLTGVRLDQMHASDLKPTNIRRSFYAASASAARHYESLRVVHVMESRVEDLREANRDERDNSVRPESQRGLGVKPENAPEQNGNGTDKKDARDKNDPQGVSRREMPLAAPHTLHVDDKVHSSGTAARTDGTQGRGGLA